tara:strand:- start:34 stop:531 length:498 start_codon:yes stop_codon:yes gene_type:complete
MNLKNLSKNFYIETSIILIIFLLDRFSKIFVIYLDKKNPTSEIYISKFLNINLIWNDGIAFGLFSFEKTNLYNFLSIVILLIIIFILIMIIKTQGIKKYPLLILFGGALGNIFDRIIYRSVPDFIDFHVGNFHWFVFNIADVFITFGVIFMILLEITGNNKQTKL